jgi:hypothetical protein
MKKKLAIVLAMLFVLTLLCGCGGASWRVIGHKENVTYTSISLKSGNYDAKYENNNSAGKLVTITWPTGLTGYSVTTDCTFYADNVLVKPAADTSYRNAEYRVTYLPNDPAQSMLNELTIRPALFGTQEFKAIIKLNGEQTEVTFDVVKLVQAAEKYAERKKLGL